MLQKRIWEIPLFGSDRLFIILCIYGLDINEPKHFLEIFEYFFVILR